MKIFIKLFIFIIIISNTPLYKVYSQTEHNLKTIKKGIVLTTQLNITTGTTLNHNTIKVAQKNDILNIIGDIDDWYIIQLQDKTVGVAPKNNINIIDNNINNLQKINDDIEKIFYLINKTRLENNLEPLELDENLNNIAMIKAKDMVENKYIGHKSPTYDTPFKMLKNMNINYDFAIENIMEINKKDSIENKIKNNKLNVTCLLNENFNKVGITSIKSSNNKKIIIQIFLKEKYKEDDHLGYQQY